MIRLIIIRTAKTDEGFAGTLLFDGKLFCTALQIGFDFPAGIYPLNHFDGSKWKNTLEITASGYADLYFHGGNETDSAMNSFVLVNDPNKLNGNRSLLNSGNTFKLFQKEVVPNVNLGDEVEIIDFYELHKKGEGIMLGKLFKSKTISFNISIGAILGILLSYGIIIPEWIIISIFVFGNFILRLITKKSIEEK
jgi:hypothetical protein